MSASIYFQSGQVVLDNNGKVAPGAKLYFFDGDTTTKRNTYSNSALTSQRTHPVLADGYGRIPVIYLDYGTFDVRATTSGGTQLFYHTGIANPAPFDDTTTFDTSTVLATGDIFSSLLNGTRTGAVRLNGRTIGNVTSSATERANDDTSDLFAHIYDNLADAQAPVSGGRGASAAEDFAASKRITLPDWRGCGPIGFDDMGNTAASLLGSAPVVTGGPTTTGSILGANTHTISEANLPTHTHSFSATSGGVSANHTHAISLTSATESQSHTHTGTSGTESADHTHGVTAGTQLTQVFGGGGTVYTALTSSGGTITSSGKSATHTHTTTTGNASVTHTHAVAGDTGNMSGDHTHSVSGTTGTGSGSGTAHNIVARSGLVTWFIKL